MGTLQACYCSRRRKKKKIIKKLMNIHCGTQMHKDQGGLIHIFGQCLLLMGMPRNGMVCERDALWVFQLLAELRASFANHWNSCANVDRFQFVPSSLKRAAAAKCQNMIYYPKRPFIEWNNSHSAHLDNKKGLLLLKKWFRGEKYPVGSRKTFSK